MHRTRTNTRAPLRDAVCRIDLFALLEVRRMHPAFFVVLSTIPAFPPVVKH